MRKWQLAATVLGALILLVPADLRAEAAQADAPQLASDVGTAPVFAPDERVVFLGDSIFHGGKVHANVLLFYATRGNAAAMRFHNAGIAGDMASEAARRMAWDVKPFAPSAAVVMFGMNDVGRWLYGEGKDSPANLEQRTRMLEAHRAGMAAIIDQLPDAKVIICTPTPFDQTTRRETANALGVDDALAEVAKHARQLAQAHELGLVDFHAAMNEVTRRQQAIDPSFTMMDAARVHPDDAGHMLMTYVFLKAQQMPATVAEVVIDAVAGEALKTENCTVTELTRAADGVTFSYAAQALPYPVTGRARAALAWVPFMEELNRETLTVRGLQAGTYELRIDEQAVGSWSAEQLAAGVNLAEIEGTPQYQQAAEMAALNEKRRARENATLRVFAALEHDVLRPKGVDVTDMAEVKRVMDQAIEEEGRKKSWRHSYFTNLTKAYLAEKPRQAEIERELETMTARLIEMARPVARKVELRRLSQQ